MKNRIVMAGVVLVTAAVCIIGISLYREYQRIHQQVMDGDGMVYKGVGLPEEVRGRWVSDDRPQWSLDVGEWKTDIYHYGQIQGTIEICYYPVAGNDIAEEGLDRIELFSETFAWPYSRSENATVMEASVYPDRIRLLVRFDDESRDTLWFRPLKEGEELLTEKEALPEGVTLEGLKFHVAGSYIGPYYSIRHTDEGFIVCTSFEEMFWPEIDGEDTEAADPGEYEAYTTVNGKEIAGLNEALLEYNILAWDGFDRYVSAPEGVLDMDDFFTFSALYSDGRVISAKGYNAVPPDYNSIAGILLDFFGRYENSLNGEDAKD